LADADALIGTWLSRQWETDTCDRETRQVWRGFSAPTTKVSCALRAAIILRQARHRGAGRSRAHVRDGQLVNCECVAGIVGPGYAHILLCAALTSGAGRCQRRGRKYQAPKAAFTSPTR
jgi:hypothetical protein